MHGAASFPADKNPYPRPAQSKFPPFPPLGRAIRHYEPVKRETINQSPFNLDNFTFIRYIFFKCNKTSAGALIRIRLSIMLLLRAAARRDRQAAVASI